VIRLPLIVLVCVVTGYVSLFLIGALWPQADRADLAVVLGNQVLADGQPSRRLAARLNAGAQAYRAGLVPLILVSGGIGASGFDEASVMREYLLHAGIPASAILVDSAGVDTRATARNTVSVMRAMNLNRVLVVTQYFHIPRCILALRLAGAASVGATYPTYVEVRDLFSLARELVALPVYAFHR
jgi:vancomycin permeability regulator SanA